MVGVEAEAVNSRKIVLTGEWRMGLKARRCDSQAGTEGWGGTSQAEVKKVLLLSVGQVSAAKDLSQREATAGLPDVRAGQGRAGMRKETFLVSEDTRTSARGWRMFPVLAIWLLHSSYHGFGADSNLDLESERR